MNFANSYYVQCHSPFGLIGHQIEQAVIASDLNKTKFCGPTPDQQDQVQSLQDQDQDQYQFLSRVSILILI